MLVSYKPNEEPEMKIVHLTDDEVERLRDLLHTQFEDTRDGERSGYGQDRADELDDIKTLIAKVEFEGGSDY